MDEEAGRDERKSRMHGVGESQQTNPIKGVEKSSVAGNIISQ